MIYKSTKFTWLSRQKAEHVSVQASRKNIKNTDEDDDVFRR